MSVWKENIAKHKYQQCKCGHLFLYHNERTGICEAYNMRKAVRNKSMTEGFEIKWDEEKCDCSPPVALDTFF